MQISASRMLLAAALCAPLAARAADDLDATKARALDVDFTSAGVGAPLTLDARSADIWGASLEADFRGMDPASSLEAPGARTLEPAKTRTLDVWEKPVQRTSPRAKADRKAGRKQARAVESTADLKAMTDAIFAAARTGGEFRVVDAAGRSSWGTAAQSDKGFVIVTLLSGSPQAKLLKDYEALAKKGGQDGDLATGLFETTLVGRFPAIAYAHATESHAVRAVFAPVSENWILVVTASGEPARAGRRLEAAVSIPAWLSASPGDAAIAQAAKPPSADEIQEVRTEVAPTCSMGSDGQFACGYNCRIGADGRTNCANFPEGTCSLQAGGSIACEQQQPLLVAAGPTPCSMGSDGITSCANTANGVCRMNTDGTTTCSALASTTIVTKVVPQRPPAPSIDLKALDGSSPALSLASTSSGAAGSSSARGDYALAFGTGGLYAGWAPEFASRKLRFSFGYGTIVNSQYGEQEVGDDSGLDLAAHYVHRQPIIDKVTLVASAGLHFATVDEGSGFGIGLRAAGVYSFTERFGAFVDLRSEFFPSETVNGSWLQVGVGLEYRPE